MTFIFIEESNGQLLPQGTGFFVGIKHESRDGYVVYLVTAKHVLRNPDTNKFYDKILLRLNTKEGRVEYISLDLSKHTILTHPDDNVDLAATLIYPPQEHFNYLYITEAYFTNTDILVQKGIREGSRAFFAGLLANFYYGKQRNYPVVRFGYISLLTDEKIEITSSTIAGSKINLNFYLVECQSLGGFSGSPVFFERERIMRDPPYLYASPEVYLGGVLMGHFNDIEGLKKNHVRNLGLALIIPCYLLNELLHTENAKQQRLDPELDY